MNSYLSETVQPPVITKLSRPVNGEMVVVSNILIKIGTGEKIIQLLKGDVKKLRGKGIKVHFAEGLKRVIVVCSVPLSGDMYMRYVGNSNSDYRATVGDLVADPYR
jgi:hypothetical protein